MSAGAAPDVAPAPTAAPAVPLAHRLVAIAVAVMGWVLGTLAAWTQSPLYKYCQIAFAERPPECRRALYGWIPKLALYWHWPVATVLLFGSIYFVVAGVRRRVEQTN